MHIQSTINPLSRSETNIPVAIFCYQGQRRFLRVSEEYEETMNRVGTAFGIGKHIQSFVLQSSSLDVCKGHDVVVDPSAYPLLWTFLDEITVAADGCLPTSTKDAEQLPTPSGTPVVADSSSDIGTFSDEEDKLPVKRGKERAHEEEAEEEEEKDEVEQQVAAPEPPQDDEYDGLNPSDEEFFLEQQKDKHEEVQEEEDEYYEEPAQPAVVEPKEKSKFKAAATEETDITVPSVKKEKNVDLPPPSSSVKTEPSKTAGSSSKKVTTGEDLPKAESSKSGGSSSKKGTAAAAATNDDSRFEITIHPPGTDDENEGAKFKLRGRYTVGKVLQAACRTFELDINRARLIHAIDVPLEDGDVFTEEYKCPPEDTVADCGIDGSSKLFIMLDPKEDDELEEDSE